MGLAAARFRHRISRVFCMSFALRSLAGFAFQPLASFQNVKPRKTLFVCYTASSPVAITGGGLRFATLCGKYPWRDFPRKNCAMPGTL